jgi:cardiolipin synthase
MKLLLPQDYVSQAAADVRKATKRVYLISMVIADHPATHELITEIEAAAKRGVTVHVAADIFTYGEVSGSFLPLRYNSPNAKLVTKMAKTLRAAGVKFHWLGRARLTIFNGRTHNKWCVVDDTCYVFGGVNMYEGGIHNVDYMFRTVNTALADRLVHEQTRIQKAERTTTNHPSARHGFGNDTVLIDGGIITQSIIYRRACELAKEADKILYVSQYCPTGKLARILKRKKTKFYFNSPDKTSGLNAAFIRFSIFISGLKSRYSKNKAYLHAKFIIFTLPDGSKAALTGSHNFAYTGVTLGTREIALETKDPAVISQLESFYKEHVA